MTLLVNSMEKKESNFESNVLNLVHVGYGRVFSYIIFYVIFFSQANCLVSSNIC